MFSIISQSLFKNIKIQILKRRIDRGEGIALGRIVGYGSDDYFIVAVIQIWNSVIFLKIFQVIFADFDFVNLIFNLFYEIVAGIVRNNLSAFEQDNFLCYKLDIRYNVGWNQNDFILRNFAYEVADSYSLILSFGSSPAVGSSIKLGIPLPAL